MKKTLTIHIDSEVLNQFKNYCKLNALKLSAKVELLLKNEMVNAKSNPTLVQLFEELLEKRSFNREAAKPEQSNLQKQPVLKYAPKQKEVDRHIQTGSATMDINKMISDVKKKTPTLDQLRTRRGL